MARRKTLIKEEHPQSIETSTKTKAQIEHEKAKKDLEAKWLEEEKVKEEIKRSHINKINRARETFEEGDNDVKKQVLDKFEKEVKEYIKKNKYGDAREYYEVALKKMKNDYQSSSKISLTTSSNNSNISNNSNDSNGSNGSNSSNSSKSQSKKTVKDKNSTQIVKHVSLKKPYNRKVWICPNCGNGNVGKVCVLCGTTKPVIPKKKLKLDDNAKTFDPEILENLEDYEDVVLNGITRKNINVKNWLFRYLNSKKTRTETVSECIERAVLEYYKDDIKGINKSIRETLKDAEYSIKQISYDSKKVRKVKETIRNNKNKKNEKNQ